MQRIRQNRFALKREKDNQREQQPYGCHRSEFIYKRLFEIILSLMLDDAESYYNACQQGYHHKQHYGENKGVPGNGDSSDAEKETDNRHESRQQNKVVDRNLHECISGVALRQVAPHENHGRARSCTEQHRPSKVFIGKIERNKIFENHKKEEPGDAEHCKWLYDPVGDAGHDNTFRLLSNAFNALEINFKHHRKHHHPYQYCDWDADVSIFPFAQRVWESGP